MISPVKRSNGFYILLFCLVLVLGTLFYQSFLPGKVHFSNDGPLGAASAQFLQPPASFLGMWEDLNSIGFSAGSFSLGLTGLIYWILGPLYAAKFYPPLTLLILGLSAGFAFRQWKLAPVASVLGGLAAALNSDLFSNSCWGVGPQAISLGLDFVAVGLLGDRLTPRRWIRIALAGFAVGVSVVEGADVGAIFSVVVAAYVIYQAWIEEGVPVSRISRGVGRVFLVAVLAAFMATHALTGLISTYISGVVGTQQDSQTKEARWGWATQWSLPEQETLSLVIPGLFGYRMDTLGGANYWGGVGRDASWDRYFKEGNQGPKPDERAFVRHIGSGFYAGVLVVLLAIWTATQSFRKKDSVFTPNQRKLIWFWIGTFFISLLFAFGRHAPFYQLLYKLPYFSTIRNPIKFMHVANWSLIVLFAYGVHGLSRRYMETATTSTLDLVTRLQNLWAKAGTPEKRWLQGCLVAIAAALLGWGIYANARPQLEHYLQMVLFSGEMAHAIALFSISQVGWFVLFLILSVGTMALILSGQFTGSRARWGGILLGLVLVADLSRANQPWILYWNYKEKYASNAVIDLLREKPYEHRVAVLPFRAPPELSLFSEVYGIEWVQQLFQYYNVQSLDIIQMRSATLDMASYESAISSVVRRWELTNTRYLLGPTGYLEALNQQLDPQHRFRIVTRFEMVPKPGIARPTNYAELTAETSPNGQYALFEFTGALPRARLYTNWQVNTNEEAVLQELSSPTFDPSQKLLLSAGPLCPNATTTNQNIGTVEYASYTPKRIALKAKAEAPSVLLLNDKFDSSWRVTVDGKPAELLRCNYIMRGVYLQPGQHDVVFRFTVSNTPMYISLAAMGVAILLMGLLVVSKSDSAVVPETVPAPRETAKK
ncbi:MAG: Bacterial rane protein YfhO [Pedosphaera sp.]|nr:Bacterial rane protein YfhO [Pedosphaera sp.]